MKVKGYGARPPQNIGAGGRRPSYDPYNRFAKGHQYFRVPEYASQDVEEYYRVDEIKDMTRESEREKDRRQNEQRGRDQGANNVKQFGQRVLQQVVGIIAGSVVIVSSYQAMAAKQQQPVPEPPSSVVETQEQGSGTPSGQQATEPVPEAVEPEQEPEDAVLTEWQWGDDLETVTLVLTNGKGLILKKIAGTVKVTHTDPTCTKQDVTTYSATAEDRDEGETYHDTRYRTKPALGHSFGEGKEIVLENGETGMTFECSRCHETFTIQTSMTENDQ